MEDLGWILAGRYRLLEMLGQGGMGAVWRARDEQLDRDVAVKELRLPDGLDAAQRQVWVARVDREARAAARLKHPGIITVHDRITGEDGRPWIVMELVNGRSLDDLIRTQGPLPAGQVVQLGRQMLSALEAAHQAGITHRDIKPANVLLEGGQAILTDFGISVIAGDPALTGTGIVLGTPAFMSPEQVQGLPATAASDLWSVGATLYAAAEGRPPFQGPTPSAVFVAISTQEPAPATHAGALEPLLRALLRKEPHERPSIPALQAMLDRPAVVAPPAPAPASGSSRISRIAWITGGGVAAVALVGGLGFAALHLGPGSSSSDRTASGPLKSPMELSLVQIRHPAPCNTAELRSQNGHLCYTPTGGGFIVTSVKKIALHGQIMTVSLLPADANRFLSLTSVAAGEYEMKPAPPNGEIAVQVGGQVAMTPTVTGPIVNGEFQLSDPSQGGSIRQLFHRLTGR